MSPEQHTGKKITLVLGYLDSSHTNGLSNVHYHDKIPKVFEQQNVTSPRHSVGQVANGHRHDLVDYLNRNQVPKDTRVVIISFCKSFASKMHNSIGPEFVDYQNFAGNLDQDKVIHAVEGLPPGQDHLGP